MDDPKFAHLLTPNIWSSRYKNIKAILEMKEWDDPRFAPLLTSNIWGTSVKNIEDTLKIDKLKEPRFAHLLTSNIWQSNATVIKDILDMEEWDDPRFAPLLTSNIWKSNKNDIKAILHNKRLQSPTYSHLLTPGIFNVSIKNIDPSLDLLEEYGVGVYATNRCLRRNVNFQRTLFEYLTENDIPIVIENTNGNRRLNPIINVSNTVLKQKYGIDLKALYHQNKGKIK